MILRHFKQHKHHNESIFLTWRAGKHTFKDQTNLSSRCVSQLLQELCTVFNVDLPCRVKSSQLGIISNKQSNTSAIVTPQPSSCSYICQHCLVHLGDIGEDQKS